MLLLVAAAIFLSGSSLPRAAAESPTAFVNARPNRQRPAAWLQITNVTPAQGGRADRAGRIAGLADCGQAGLMRQAMDANVPLAEIDVGDVATGPNETCASWSCSANIAGTAVRA